MNQYSQLGGIFMAAWLGWVARERRMRTRGRRQLEHCPLLPTCCRCVSGIAHCPIKVPPAHTLTVKCTQRAPSLTHRLEQVWGYVSCARGFGFASYAFDLLVLSLCFPLSFSVLQTRSTPSCWSLLWKIERKKGKEMHREAMCQNERKNTQSHVVRSTDRLRHTVNKPISHQCPSKKNKTPASLSPNLFLLRKKEKNYLVLIAWPVARIERPVSRTDGLNTTTRSWTEPPSTQMGCRQTNAEWWSDKSDDTQDRQTNNW